MLIVMNERKIMDQFAYSDSILEIWSAARELMANRLLSEYIDVPIFLDAFDRILKFSIAGSSIDRLLAIDLLVRLPAASKKLSARAEVHLNESLRVELPPLHFVNNHSNLPKHAKPADIRENIALGLKHAQGEWVENYLLKSIVNEHQSQRTREVLINELVTRSDQLSALLETLIHSFKILFSHKDQPSTLLSICQAFTRVISQNRQIINVGSSSPKMLDALAGCLAKYSGKGPIPQKLEHSAIAMVGLLDELLTIDIALFIEEESYLPLRRISGWWNLRSYPRQLNSALSPIVSKITSAISIRAKMGQKSHELIGCLRNAVQDADRVSRIRSSIADSTSLIPDIDDWLRGNQRNVASRSSALQRALQSVDDEDGDVLIGNLLILSAAAMRSIDSGNVEQATNTAIAISNRIQSASLQRRLRTEGEVGDIVDYVPSAHGTSDSDIPLGHKVRLESPTVVRVREDGTRDVVIRAVVSELKDRF